MNKKISQFELTNKLQEQDLITLVQDGSNKNITSGDLTTSLSDTFATNERVDGVEEDIEVLDNKVSSNYTDLSNKIIEGDNNVTNNLGSTINSYYDVLNNKIITLDNKHDADMSRANNTIQEWIDDIDDKSTLDQLHDALNRLTIAENTITSLAELLANGGGGGGDIIGYHTQATNTIFPLTGYYKGNSADPLSTSDTLNQALSKLENQVEAIAENSGSLPIIKSYENTQASDGTLYTSLKTDRTFLKKTGDTAEGRIDFKQGLQGGTIFRQGWDGQGASLYPAGTKWNLELDNLFVRGNMTVNELTVNEIKAVGGDMLVTLGDMKCTQVEQLSDGYKCYFDDEEGTKYNEFVVNDMAICQQFDGKNVKRYWRKVNEVGSNYIVLSLDVCEPGSGVPGEGDVILQLGHMFEADPDYNLQMDERRNAIFISAKGQNAPRMTYYKGIDEFTLADDPDNGVVRERVVIGGEQTKFVGTIYQTSDTGITRMPVYRGVWVQGNKYYYYDQVSHNGSLWICMKPDGSDKEPSDHEDDWQKQVSKGDAGTPSDDVAKWVEITGDRMFLYETPDDSGTPTPARLGVNATIHGITNPNFIWTRKDTGAIVSKEAMWSIEPSLLGKGNRTLTFRCTVTNEDGAEYYDEIQVAKLFNGAEGADAYYVDLDNGTVVIPYGSDEIADIDITSIKSEIMAYRGLERIRVVDATVRTTKGNATAVISPTFQSISLTSFTRNPEKVAEITIDLTLEDGYTISKVWYISSTRDGENGYNGEDAMYLTLSGDQYFHYKSGELIPSPQEITLTADDKNVVNPVFTWYYSEAGKYAWAVIPNEVNKTLKVKHDSAWMRVADEVSFKCVVSNSSGAEFYDIITINKVRDGENVYRATLQNENCSIVTDENGKFTADAVSVAKTTSRLKYGNQEITNYKLLGHDKPSEGKGPALNYNDTTKVISFPTLSSSINQFTTDAVTYAIEFEYVINGVKTIVDTVDFTISKSKQGVTGLKGKNSVTIYINSDAAKVDRPTFTTLPTGTSGSNWSLDAHPNSNTSTWSSTGTYDPNTGYMVPFNEDLDQTKYYWTNPKIVSGKDGADGKSIKGDDGFSPYINSDGRWVYKDEHGEEVTGRYAQGDTGPSGPALTFRGMWTDDKTYYWNDYRRDVVTVTSDSDYRIITVASSKGNINDFEEMTSFEMVATNVLLAQRAAIAGWQFDPTGYIYSPNGHVVLQSGNDNSTIYPVIAVGDNDMIKNNDTTQAVNDALVSNCRVSIFKNGQINVGKLTKIGSTYYGNAGITGDGDDSTSVRFWAGSTHSGRATAPFRVQHDGTLYATSGHFTGNVTCKSLTVSDRSKYGAPGIILILHYNFNAYTTLYSLNGVACSGISRSTANEDKGLARFVITHNIGHKNYTVLVIGANRGNDGAFIGSNGCISINDTQCKIHTKDTRDNEHLPDNAAAVDIIFIGYEK